MSTVQLASVTLRETENGKSVRGILEWRKDAGYAAYITDVDIDGMSVARNLIVAHDQPTDLRALADLIEAETEDKRAQKLS